MYQSPTQSGQWNPNGPPTSQAGQQPQQQWSPQPPSGQQPFQQQPQGAGNRIPPISQAVQPPSGPAMQTLQPTHPDQYRALPPPQPMYSSPPYPAQQMQYASNQPAPRQRTAIACRYCRRRKIRCSGFDQSEDGRCTNCQRFSQECVFTPVSAQTQAFVPAHTVYRGQNPPPNTQLYGAFGQPLPYGGREPFPPPGQPQQPGQYPPPPPGYQQQQQQMYPPQQGGQPPMSAPQPDAGRKRTSDEPHTPTLPPPNPATQAQAAQRANAEGQPPYAFPDAPGATPSEKDSDISPHERKDGSYRLRNGDVKDAGVQTDLSIEFLRSAN